MTRNLEVLQWLPFFCDVLASVCLAIFSIIAIHSHSLSLMAMLLLLTALLVFLRRLFELECRMRNVEFLIQHVAKQVEFVGQKKD